MNILELIIERYPDELLITVNDFDNCVVGIDDKSMRLICSVSKCLEKLKKDGMEYEDALDHFYFNIQGTYIGENMPIFMEDDFL